MWPLNMANLLHYQIFVGMQVLLDLAITRILVALLNYIGAILPNFFLESILTLR